MSQPPSQARALKRTLTAQYWIFAATALSLLTLIVFPRALRGRTEGSLHPHGYCYIWDTALVSAHVAADVMIGAAYVAISVALGYLVHRVRQLLPFHWMFLAFGLFILTCGATHFMDVWTLWYADFWASAALKLVTAVASVATALALPPLIPQAVRLLQSAAESERHREQLHTARRERKEVEAQSQAKDMFLATLSHELRTPLNAMGGWVSVLETSLTSFTPQQRKAFQAIRRNHALQTRLVEDMLDVSSILTGRLTLDRSVLDLETVVRSAVDAAHAADGQTRARIRIDALAPHPHVLGDDMRLQQVFINLLSNAVKFSRAATPIRVEIRAHGGHASVSVIDEGEGIPADFLPRVFDPFAQADQSTTRQTGGLGLGLAIVRHLVEQHGGTVTATSDGPGAGSTFTVRLPLAASAGAP